MAKGNFDLFFSAGTSTITFQEALSKVQKYISDQHAELLNGEGAGENGNDTEEFLKRYMRQFFIDESISVEGYNIDELVNELYVEMAEFSILTKYLDDVQVEEININKWKDIEIQYSDGRREKIKERFDSPEHAKNVLRRMLQRSNTIIDNAKPIAYGTLGKNIRLTGIASPVTDDSAGMAASIRIVNQKALSRNDLIASGSGTEDMFELLRIFLQYGVSMCIAGSTSSGKTTLLQCLLESLSDETRMVIIESGSRELNIAKFDESDNAVNSVVNLLTRPSENKDQNVDQEDLLETTLRLDPDLIVIGEMRSKEAYAAQNAARTGHTVTTTIHSNSAEDTYGRMLSLCKLASDLKKEDLMEQIAEAFPIVVYACRMGDKKRRITEILECSIDDDGRIRYNPLYRFAVRKTTRNEGKITIEGEHRRVGTISKKLFRRMLDNALPVDEIEKIPGGMKLYSEILEDEEDIENKECNENNECKENVEGRDDLWSQWPQVKANDSSENSNGNDCTEPSVGKGGNTC